MGLAHPQPETELLERCTIYIYILDVKMGLKPPSLPDHLGHFVADDCGLSPQASALNPVSRELNVRVVGFCIDAGR